MRYEEMKPEDYRRAKEAAPIAYVPWGAHEWHGKQNPLGLDTLKAHGQCLALCAETGGIVFPHVYCGFQTMKPHAGFDCTLEFTAECVKLLATEYLEQLADEGFKVIVILMGHYGNHHQEAIREVVTDFNENHPGCTAWAFPDYEPTADEGFAGEHAACFETSYMMWFRPELVDLTRLPQDGELDNKAEGVHGLDPRTNASPKKGRDGTNCLVRNAAPKILELLRLASS
jgi:creatinine amidohydrolase